MVLKMLNLVCSRAKFILILSCFSFVASNARQNYSIQVKLKEDNDLNEVNYSQFLNTSSFNVTYDPITVNPTLFW